MLEITHRLMIMDAETDSHLMSFSEYLFGITGLVINAAMNMPVDYISGKNPGRINVDRPDILDHVRYLTGEETLR